MNYGHGGAWPWQRACSAERTESWQGNRGGEGNRGRESPCIPAPAERIAICGAQTQRGSRERRRGGKARFYYGESGLTGAVVVRGGGLVRAPATSHDGGAFPTPTRSGQRTWLQATSRRVAAAGLEPTRTGVSAWVDSSAHLARPSALLLWNCDGTSVGFGGKLSSLWWRCFQHLPTLTLPCPASVPKDVFFSFLKVVIMLVVLPNTAFTLLIILSLSLSPHSFLHVTLVLLKVKHCSLRTGVLDKTLIKY